MRRAKGREGCGEETRGTGGRGWGEGRKGVR